MPFGLRRPRKLGEGDMADDLVWVGLDLGQASTSICVVDQDGGVLLEETCRTDLGELEAALSPFPAQLMGLVSVEAGQGVYIVRKLLQRGFPVRVFEARKASKFLAIRRNKTDSSDARGLADLGRLGQNTVSEVYLKSIECQELRSQLVMRHRLVRLRVSAEASVRARFALHGRRLKASNVPGSFRKHGEACLKELLGEEGLDLEPELGPLLNLCEGLRTYLAKADRALAQRAKQHSVCRRLMEVPGVGPICAISFYSAIEEPSRFRRATDVGAYLGLTPRRHQSGELSRTMGITKTGNKMTRSHLVTAATVLRQHGGDSALRVWALKASERIGPYRARVALARKLAVVLLVMWKTGTHFDPQRGIQVRPVAPEGLN
jgi:transposase